MLDHAAMLDDYFRYRDILTGWQMEAAETLRDQDLDAAATRLGRLLDGNRFIGSSDEVVIIADVALYDRRHGGTSLIERYLAALPDPQDTDEAALRQAIPTARFSIFEITAVEDGVGVQIVDRRDGSSTFVTDVLLSATAEPAWMLLGRLVPLNDFGMLTGAPVLPEDDAARAIEAALAARFPGRAVSDLVNLSPEEEGDFTDLTLATALAAQPRLLDENLDVLAAFALLDELAELYSPEYVASFLDDSMPESGPILGPVPDVLLAGESDDDPRLPEALTGSGGNHGPTDRLPTRRCPSRHRSIPSGKKRKPRNARSSTLAISRDARRAGVRAPYCSGRHALSRPCG